MRSVTHSILILVFLFVGLTSSYADKHKKEDVRETYLWQLRRVTHRGQTFDVETWDARVIWFATFFDDGFRRSFDEKHIKINHLDPAESEKWLEDERYRQNKQWEFFISLYTKKDYKKFSMDPDSFWKIYLTTENGEVVRPISIEQVPVTPYERIMFRRINRWSKTYRVAFPKVELGKNIQVTLQSVVGQSYIEWRDIRVDEQVANQ